MDKPIYALMVVKKEAKLNLPGEPVLPLVFADGMVGIIPVFESEESAKEYRGGDVDAEIFAIAMKK